MYGVMLFEIWPIQAAMPLLENVGRLCPVQFGMARWHFLSTFYYYSAVIHTLDPRTSKPSRWQKSRNDSCQTRMAIVQRALPPSGTLYIIFRVGVLMSLAVAAVHTTKIDGGELQDTLLRPADARVSKSLIYPSS